MEASQLLLTSSSSSLSQETKTDWEKRPLSGLTLSSIGQKDHHDHRVTEEEEFLYVEEGEIF